MTRLGAGLAGALWLAAPSPHPAAAAARPFVLEDIAGFRTIREVRVSPDGTRAAFTVRSADLASNRFETHLWLAPLDPGRGAPRQLTFHEAPESSPRWSPDGSRIAFLSKRGEHTQVWAVPADGGEARPLTSHLEPVAAFEWSPDGRKLLVLAPLRESEDEARRKKEKEDSYLLGRHWRNHRLWTGAEGGSLEPLTDGASHVRTAVWSPDGRRIAFLATPDPEADSSEDAQAHVLELETREVRVVPGGRLASSLAWSPDGRTLAFVRAFDGRGFSREDLHLWPVGAREARNLSRALDRDVEGFRYAPDGRAVFIQLALGASDAVARLPLDGSESAFIWKPGHTLPALEPAPEGWVYVRGDRPAELSLSGERGERPRLLTALNAAAAEVQLPSLEVVSWKGATAEIEGVLVRPHGFEASRRYPLIVNPHGGPRGRSTAQFDPQAAYFASLGFLVLQPNFRGSTGYGDGFAKANVADWGEGPLADVLAGVDQLVARGAADPDRLFLYGWSYGGYLTNWAISHTDRFRAAASGAGVADLRMQYVISDARRWRFDYFAGSPFEGNQPLYEKQSPITYVRKARVPTLFIHGEKDERCPLAQGLMMYRALKDNGVPAELVVYPREGHGFSEPRHILDRARRVAEWFRRYDPKGNERGPGEGAGGKALLERSKGEFPLRPSGIHSREGETRSTARPGTRSSGVTSLSGLRGHDASE